MVAVQLSMFLFCLLSFQQQLVYTITIVLLCQQLFYISFNFFFVIQNLELIKFICLNCCLSSQLVYNTTYFDCCQHTFLIFLFIIYGLWPKAPSSVRVSPLIYLKSGEASCTHTRPISFSTSPKCPIGGVFTFALNASG